MSRQVAGSSFSLAFQALHLMCVLFWLQDRSPEQRSTRELLAFTQETLARLRPALGLPPVVKSLAHLARILSPMFGPPEISSGPPPIINGGGG